MYDMVIVYEDDTREYLSDLQWGDIMCSLAGAPRDITAITIDKLYG